MGEFKLPSAQEYREFIQSLPDPYGRRKEILAVLDYAAAHPSTIEEAIEQVRRAEAKRRDLAMKRP